MDRLTEKEIQALNDLRYYCSMSQDLGINYTEMNNLCDVIEKALKELEQKRQLEKQIGCPLEVRCKLYDGANVYDEYGRKMLVQELGEHDFLAYPTKEPYTPCLMYIKGYKKSWWLKADRSE